MTPGPFFFGVPKKYQKAVGRARGCDVGASRYTRRAVALRVEPLARLAPTGGHPSRNTATPAAAGNNTRTTFDVRGRASRLHPTLPRRSHRQGLRARLASACDRTGRLRTLTAALRRGAPVSGNPARLRPELVMSQTSMPSRELISSNALLVSDGSGTYRAATADKVLCHAKRVLARRVATIAPHAVSKSSAPAPTEGGVARSRRAPSTCPCSAEDGVRLQPRLEVDLDGVIFELVVTEVPATTGEVFVRAVGEGVHRCVLASRLKLLGFGSR